jgi:flagellar assembly protein FliH
MTSSKLIRRDALGGDPATWDAPEVKAPAGTVNDAADEEEQLNAIRARARDRGFQEGHAAGLAAAQAEITERSNALECVLQALTRPMQELDHRVEEEIFALVQAVAQQLLRRELASDPSHLIPVIREGLAALPAASGEVVVRMHPQDAEVVRKSMRPSDDDRPWRVESDPVIERGGCVIVSPRSQVDGRLQTRIGRAIATMFEDQRGDEG